MKSKYLVIHGKGYFTVTHNKIDHTIEIPCVFVIDRMRYTLYVFSCYYNNPKIPLIQSDGSVINVALELPARLQYTKYISVAYAEKLRTENQEYVYIDNFIDIFHYIFMKHINASCFTFSGDEYVDLPLVSDEMPDYSKLHKQQSMGKVDRHGFRVKRRKR